MVCLTDCDVFQAAFFLLLLGLTGAGLVLVGELLAAGHRTDKRDNSNLATTKGEERRCAQVIQRPCDSHRCYNSGAAPSGIHGNRARRTLQEGRNLAPAGKETRCDGCYLNVLAATGKKSRQVLKEELKKTPKGKNKVQADYKKVQ